jgi:alkylation response protein AidB-like acyl-CoA dehydrogenase
LARAGATDAATQGHVHGGPPEPPGPTPRRPALLAGLPGQEPLRRVWRQLGAEGAIEGLYRRDGADLKVNPSHLRDVLRALDARGRSGITLAACVQIATALPILAEGRSPAARAALAAAMSGKSVTAVAATDSAAAGSDLTGLATEVDIGSGGVRLRGGKQWITNATTCDQLLVLARHRPGRHFTSFAWVLVPHDAPGVAIRPANCRLFDGGGIGHVEMDQVCLPPGCLIGQPGRGMSSFARHITRERLAGAFWAAALCRRVLRAARERLTTRCSGGEPLWSRDALRQRFAAAVVAARMLESITAELAPGIADGYNPAAAALLKTATARTVSEVLEQYAALQGAAGYGAGQAQDLRAEAAVFGIGGGSTDLMLDIVADSAAALLAEEPA